MLKAEELAAANRGEGCLGRSAEDEPVFVLVARDRFAADLVRLWADRVEAAAQASAELTAERKEQIASARRNALRMDDWRTAHGGGKLPG